MTTKLLARVETDMVCGFGISYKDYPELLVEETRLRDTSPEF